MHDENERSRVASSSLSMDGNCMFRTVATLTDAVHSGSAYLGLACGIRRSQILFIPWQAVSAAPNSKWLHHMTTNPHSRLSGRLYGVLREVHTGRQTLEPFPGFWPQQARRGIQNSFLLQPSVETYRASKGTSLMLQLALTGTSSCPVASSPDWIELIVLSSVGSVLYSYIPNMTAVVIINHADTPYTTPLKQNKNNKINIRSAWHACQVRSNPIPWRIGVAFPSFVTGIN
ncbi:hypothetical protein T310_7399 [Rasamsonia emersonii CBS 393.64]|uniref:Uncharacterized protein n=1 Tax=Rasamsonia emersonii (strain ATCC 16479 / CBS 393.64 / IMI 116815) TaxID=1408163 RepID=A0A0F4YKC0_RASE3|nr:hypothetical protein T310_7399 [Rasamsonia emersonii CBS 393.64]KKA18654.1 hypothetical protein T310_7399 [Rasamsonia emersonii CBS 393.64]